MCAYKLAFDADFTPSRCEARPVTAFKHIYISDFSDWSHQGQARKGDLHHWPFLSASKVSCQLKKWKLIESESIVKQLADSDWTHTTDVLSRVEFYLKLSLLP